MTKNSIPSLTVQRDSLILSPPLTHSRDRIQTLHTGQKRPLSTVVFLCPLKSNTGLIRIKSFMVGCIKQPLKRLAVPFCGSANLIQSTAQDFELKSGGLFLNKGHKPMLNYNQEPTKNNTPTLNVRLKSFFSLHNANREIIADHLTFDQVKPLSEQITGSLIKFDRMGVAS